MKSMHANGDDARAAARPGTSGALEREPSDSEPVYGAGLCVGTQYRLASYTLQESDLISFAAQWDPLAIHTDKAAAAAGSYRGLIASGVQTIAIYQRLAVRSVFRHWRVIAGRRMREAQFLRPVRAGDTLTGSLTIAELDFDEHNRTRVTTSATLVNQDGKPVLHLTVDAYMQTHP